jgi:hypothetical protein
MKIGNIIVTGNSEDILNLKISKINDIYESQNDIIVEIITYNFLEKNPMIFSTVNKFICAN